MGRCGNVGGICLRKGIKVLGNACSLQACTFHLGKLIWTIQWLALDSRKFIICQNVAMDQLGGRSRWKEMLCGWCLLFSYSGFENLWFLWFFFRAETPTKRAETPTKRAETPEMRFSRFLKPHFDCLMFQVFWICQTHVSASNCIVALGTFLIVTDAFLSHRVILAEDF